MSEKFTTDVVREGAAIVIYVSGEIDMAAAQRLRDVVEPHLGSRQTVVFDLSGVTFTDSTLLHLLVQARGSLTADGGSLMLRNPSRVAHTLLTIGGLEDLLQADADTHPSDPD